MKFIKLLLPLLLLLVFSQAETAESAAFEDTLFEKPIFLQTLSARSFLIKFFLFIN